MARGPVDGEVGHDLADHAGELVAVARLAGEEAHLGTLGQADR